MRKSSNEEMVNIAGVKKEFTILIIDDEKINVDILGSILSPTYNLLISRNGPRALEIAREYLPDLILLDVLMPDMSGFELIKELKENGVTEKIPVIFITGLSGADDEEKGFFLGAVDYIAKPFNKAIVKARVNTHIKIIDQMRMIERIGLIDPLTKIMNRRGFESRLGVEWSKAQRERTPISFFMIDADHFKGYNDTYGHQQGDVALKLVAEKAYFALKRPADFAARWGGEEFVALLPGTNLDGALYVAERIRASVEETVILTEDGTKTRITVSIGVETVMPGDETSSSEMINRADQALYKAKSSGRNQVVIFGN